MSDRGWFYDPAKIRVASPKLAAIGGENPPPLTKEAAHPLATRRGGTMGLPASAPF